VEFPRRKEFAEALQELFEKITPNNARASGIAGQIAGRLEAEIQTLRTFNDPHGLYARLPMNLMIE
jgi:protease-4